jgi:hypothetical protein
MYYDIIKTIKIISDVLNMEYNYENNKRINDYILKDMAIGLCLFNLDDIIHICKNLIDENTSQEILDNIKDLENIYEKLNSDDCTYNMSEIHNLLLLFL